MNIGQQMQIRVYTPEHAAEVADLVHEAVQAIDAASYSREEKEAWAPTPPDYDQWRSRLAGKGIYVAIIADKVVGVMDLESDGYIDFAYTHPQFQAQGIAGALYRHIEGLAHAMGMQRLYVDASIVARPFFERRGFAVVRQNRIQRSGQVLVNYTMEKGMVRLPRAQSRGVRGTD